MVKYGTAWIPVGITSSSYSKYVNYIKSITKNNIILTYYDHRDIETYNMIDVIDEFEKAGCEYFIGLLKYESNNMKQKLKQFGDIISSYKE